MSIVNRMKLTLAAATLVIGAGAGLAAAQGNDQGGPDRAGRMQQLDTNHDGKLDDAERAAARASFQARQARHAQRKAEQLQKFDTNRNGQLDDAEKQAMRDSHAAERFAKLDANRDGAISLTEFKAGRMGKGHHGGRHHRGGGDHGDQD